MNLFLIGSAVMFFWKKSSRIFVKSSSINDLPYAFFLFSRKIVAANLRPITSRSTHKELAFVVDSCISAAIAAKVEKVTF
jgi:hypothetical protein